MLIHLVSKCCAGTEPTLPGHLVPVAQLELGKLCLRLKEPEFLFLPKNTTEFQSASRYKKQSTEVGVECFRALTNTGLLCQSILGEFYEQFYSEAEIVIFFRSLRNNLCQRPSCSSGAACVHFP